MKYGKLFGIIVTCSIMLICGSSSVSAKTGFSKNLNFETMKAVAVLPFADYARKKTFLDAVKWDGRVLIYQEVKNVFMQKNINVAEPHIVQKMLQDLGAIRKLQYTTNYGSPEYEMLHSERLPALNAEIFKKIKRRQEKTTALTKEQIQMLGRKLHVDTIIRGSILHYELTPDYKVPFEGIMPMVFDDNGEMKVGYAMAQDYEFDLWNNTKLVKKHDFDMALPEGEKTAEGIIFLMYGQSTETGEVVWKAYFELPYPTLKFAQKVSELTLWTLKRSAFAQNNKGYLIRTSE